MAYYCNITTISWRIWLNYGLFKWWNFLQYTIYDYWRLFYRKEIKSLLINNQSLKKHEDPKGEIKP